MEQRAALFFVYHARSHARVAAWPPLCNRLPHTRLSHNTLLGTTSAEHAGILLLDSGGTTCRTARGLQHFIRPLPQPRCALRRGATRRTFLWRLPSALAVMQALTVAPIPHTRGVGSVGAPGLALALLNMAAL